MKILFQNHNDLRGGAWEQIKLLMHALKHECDFSADLPDLSKYDCVVLTHLNHDLTRKHYHNVQKYQTPFILKANWYPPTTTVGTHYEISDIVRDAKFIVFQSSTEQDSLMDHLENYHHQDTIPLTFKSRIIPPAVDFSIFQPKNQPRYLVHTNGIYFDWKHHQDVIRACRNLNLPVVTAGWKDKAYDDCLNEGYGVVLPQLTKWQLNEILNQTKVYVCATDMEICSGSVREAIRNQCLVISTNRHFGNSNYPKPGYWVYDHSFHDLQNTLATAYHSNLTQENTVTSVDDLVEAYHKLFSNMQPYKSFM